MTLEVERRVAEERECRLALAGLQAAAANGPAKIVAIRASIVLASAPKHNGWYVAPSDIGKFGTDYDLRAVVAVYGIAADTPVEALYPVGSFDNTGSCWTTRTGM